MRWTDAVAQFARVLAFQARQLLRTPFFVQQALTAPLAFGLLRVLGMHGAGVDMPETLWFDVAVAGIWATTTTAVGIIGFQRFQGTLEQLALSVVSPSVVFGGLCGAATAIGLVGLPIAVIIQITVSHSIAVSVFAGIAFIVATLACLVSAFLLASLFVLNRTATTFEPLILAPIWLLSGIVVPLIAMPPWLQGVALLHPLSAAVHASRSTNVDAFVLWTVISLLTSAVYLAVSRRMLKVALRRARVLGTLGLA